MKKTQAPLVSAAVLRRRVYLLRRLETITDQDFNQTELINLDLKIYILSSMFPLATTRPAFCRAKADAVVDLLVSVCVSILSSTKS